MAVVTYTSCVLTRQILDRWGTQRKALRSALLAPFPVPSDLKAHELTDLITLRSLRSFRSLRALRSLRSEGLGARVVG